jgi:hypothetical protein
MKIQVLKALVSPNMKDTAMYDGHAYPPFRTMPGAAAALVGAAERDDIVGAIVSRGLECSTLSHKVEQHHNKLSLKTTVIVIVPFHGNF